MDEEIAIINENTRNEKIKNFFVKNKNLLILLTSLIIILILSYISFQEYKDRKNTNISNQYNSIIVEYNESNKEITANKLIELINRKDPTYSPLSLYFIVDNKLIEDEEKINEYFDIIINKTSLKKEIKNLIIYKKALFNADKIEENQLLEILKPVINSQSIWKSHALYLMGEYFYSKNEKQKSKEFFSQILVLDNASSEIKIEAQKRLNRDLGE